MEVNKKTAEEPLNLLMSRNELSEYVIDMAAGTNITMQGRVQTNEKDEAYQKCWNQL